MINDKKDKKKQRLAGGSKNTNTNVNNAGNTGVITTKPDPVIGGVSGEGSLSSTPLRESTFKGDTTSTITSDKPDTVFSRGGSVSGLNKEQADKVLNSLGSGRQVPSFNTDEVISSIRGNAAAKVLQAGKDGSISTGQTQDLFRQANQGADFIPQQTQTIGFSGSGGRNKQLDNAQNTLIKEALSKITGRAGRDNDNPFQRAAGNKLLSQALGIEEQFVKRDTNTQDNITSQVNNLRSNQRSNLNSAASQQTARLGQQATSRTAANKATATSEQKTIENNRKDASIVESTFVKDPSGNPSTRRTPIRHRVSALRGISGDRKTAMQQIFPELLGMSIDSQVDSIRGNENMGSEDKAFLEDLIVR